MLSLLVGVGRPLASNFRHISSCGGVGFIQLLGSHTCVCSSRYLHLPPCQIFVIFRAVAVLASFSYSGHILVCAPRGIFICRLAKFSSYFELWRCWLHSATRVTYLCALPEVSSFAALPNFRHISSCGGVGFIQLLGSHTCVCSPRYLHLPPCHNSNYLENFCNL